MLVKNKISYFSILIAFAFLLAGNANLNLNIPHDIAGINALHSSFVSNDIQNVHKPEIGEVKIKVRYMGSECNYFACSTPPIPIAPQLVRQKQFLSYVSPVNVYFLDSFHLRGPPSLV
jgi:hypothetical protein